ncbi:MAG: ADP-ribosyl-(dinitrogen reductase) hydrolase [Pseudomonadota bacterium]
MKPFKVSVAVRHKLLHKHGVTMDEVSECFINRIGGFYEDDRLDPQTDPPTMWFVAETDRQRALKVVFCEYPDFYAIKSAFDATDKWRKVYEELCEKHSTNRSQ